MKSLENVEAARDRLAGELRSLVGDAEEMLKAASRQGNEQLAAVRERLERSVQAARGELASLEEAVLERARATARETDEYVHEHPWNAVGVAAGVGLLLGILLARR